MTSDDPIASPLEPSDTLHPVSPNELGMFATIGPVFIQAKAKEWALVLRSENIWSSTIRAQQGWMLLVHPADYAKATAAISVYEDENQNYPPKPIRDTPQHSGSRWAIVFWAIMAAFFIITGPISSKSSWFSHGKSVAQLVLTQEPWRAVTALSLHADANHILANALSGVLFTYAVHRRLGVGAGTFAIIASGTLGNFANALWHVARSNGTHASIGASTAVLGAVGLLSTLQLGRNRETNGRARKGSLMAIATPIIGGLALLGTIGSNPSSDLGAHGFGFLAGVFVGIPFLFQTRNLTRSIGKLGQIGFGVLTLVTFAITWGLAFLHI